MSDKEEKKEKVVTKYDLKMQRRKEEREREERERKIASAVGIIFVIALIVWIVSLPVLNYIAKTSTFITVNGEKVTKEEFDYNYYNKLNEYASYMSMFGLDASSDLSEQPYFGSEDMSWKDYLEQEAVSDLKTHKGISAEAKASGFSFNTDERVKEFKDSVKKAAKSVDTTVGNYLRQRYGQYASMNDIAKYVSSDAYINAYIEKLSDEQFKPTDEEIQTYYEENKSDYDLVDYYVSDFPAEVEGDDPTEEELQMAMDEASNLADAAVNTMEADGNLQENMTKSNVDDVYSDWLFDEGRKSGDAEVFVDEDNRIYYAVQFISRHLDEELTANAHIIITTADNGQTILDKYNSGEKTEASFVALWKEYSEVTSVTDGLYKNLSKDGLDTELNDWIFAQGHQAGDVGYVKAESSGTNYVIYYVSEGDPSWKANIFNTLMSDALNEYEQNFEDTIVVEDPKGNLNYLNVQEDEEEADVSGDEILLEDVTEDEDVSENGMAENDAVSGNEAVE